MITVAYFRLCDLSLGALKYKMRIEIAYYEITRLAEICKRKNMIYLLRAGF